MTLGGEGRGADILRKCPDIRNCCAITPGPGSEENRCRELGGCPSE